MFDIEIEKMKSEKTVNNAFSTLSRKADHDGERQAALTISSLKKNKQNNQVLAQLALYTLKKNQLVGLCFRAHEQLLQYVVLTRQPRHAS